MQQCVECIIEWTPQETIKLLVIDLALPENRD